MTLRLRSLLGGSLAMAGLLAVVPGTLRADDGPPSPGPLQAPPPPTEAQEPREARRARTPAELRDLVGPIALYPDVVLSSLLPASAFPLDIVQAARRLRQRTPGDTTPLSDAGWDRSVLALVQFPDVVIWLDENLEWLDQLGAAVAEQPSDVIAAIQRFREDARAAGTLATDEHQRVSTEDLPPPEDAPPGTGAARVICIRPVEPSVVYVPVYDPVVVLEPVTSIQPIYPIFTWSSGCAFDAYGPWAWHDLGWGWPCNDGWWGGGLYVHSRPCYPERSWRTHSSHGERGATQWHASGHRGSYGPRAGSGDVTTPGRPSWSPGTPFSNGTGGRAGRGGDALVQSGVVHRPAPTASTLPRFGGAGGLSGATSGAVASGPAAFTPPSYGPRVAGSQADGRQSLGGQAQDPLLHRGADVHKDRSAWGRRGDTPAPTVSLPSSTPSPLTAAPSVASTAPRSDPRTRWFPGSTPAGASAPVSLPRVVSQPLPTAQPRAWQPWSSPTLPTAGAAPTAPERRTWWRPAQTVPTPAPTPVPSTTFTAPTPRPTPTFTAPTPRTLFGSGSSSGWGRQSAGSDTAPVPSTPRPSFGAGSSSGWGRQSTGSDTPPPPPPPPLFSRHRR